MIDNDEPEIIVCVGPPTANCSGDEAVRNQLAGCPMCKRVIVHADGTETEYKARVN